jgi:alpha-L-glutamate ligase-like protein
MNWLTRWRRLRARGVLGMNRRNAECILDLNPRRLFPLVDGKRQTYELCRRIGVPSPVIYAVLTTHSALRHLPRLLADQPDYVLKPNRGAAGRGILVIVGREGEHHVRLGGGRLTAEDVRQHASSIISGLFSLGGRLDEALLQQRVIPDPILEQVSYQGTADVRVIVYKGVPVMAMLRLPTKLSGGRANLHQGAVGVGVDLASGITTSAVLYNRRVDAHPDTGASLVGFTIPCWPQMLDMARRISAATGLGFLGADIVLDRRHGPQLLEANARPGLSIQIANGQGLLPRFAEVNAATTGLNNSCGGPVPETVADVNCRTGASAQVPAHLRPLPARE